MKGGGEHMDEQLQEWIIFLGYIKKNYLTTMALTDGTLELQLENLVISMQRVKQDLAQTK